MRDGGAADECKSGGLAMTDEERSDYDLLQSKLSRWAMRGEQILPAGTRRIGHAPERAPHAYTHVLLPPLSETEIRSLEEQLDRSIPAKLREFYEMHNGCMFFDSQICVFGARSSYDRSDAVTMLEQPFELRTFIAGQDDFLDDSGYMPFGSVGYDDESNYKVIAIQSDGALTAWHNRTPSGQYRNIYNFLLKEFTVIDNTHQN
jgi:hypothetical protein